MREANLTLTTRGHVAPPRVRPFVPVPWGLAPTGVRHNGAQAAHTVQHIFETYFPAQRRWRILTSYLPLLEEKFARWQRLAAQLGVTAPTFTVHHTAHEALPEFLFGKDSLPCRYEEVAYVSCVGRAPLSGGWVFSGTLEHLAPGHVIVRQVPGQSVPPQYFDADPEQCDHCHTRRTRNETFLVRHVTTGAFRQVGRNCLSAFLGGRDAGGVLAQLAWLSEGPELLSQCASDPDDWGQQNYYLTLQEVLKVSFALIHQQGWMSRTRAQESGGASTADLVKSFICDTGRAAEKLRDRVCVTASDNTLAQDALAWVQGWSDGQQHQSEFLHNLFVLSQVEYIGLKQLGLACALAGAYARELSRREAARVAHAHKKDEPFGVVGAKPAHWQLTVKSYTSYETQYGVKHIFGLEDAEGRAAVWFGTGGAAADLGYEAAIGKTFTLRAKVKEHGTHRGRQQTVLSHVKVVR